MRRLGRRQYVALLLGPSLGLHVVHRAVATLERLLHLRESLHRLVAHAYQAALGRLVERSIYCARILFVTVQAVDNVGVDVDALQRRLDRRHYGDGVAVIVVAHVAKRKLDLLGQVARRKHVAHRAPAQLFELLARLGRHARQLLNVVHRHLAPLAQSHVGLDHEFVGNVTEPTLDLLQKRDDLVIGPRKH